MRDQVQVSQVQVGQVLQVWWTPARLLALHRRRSLRLNPAVRALRQDGERIEEACM